MLWQRPLAGTLITLVGCPGGVGGGWVGWDLRETKES